MNSQQNAQRDAITQALMNVANPLPRPHLPQMQQGDYHSRAKAIMNTGNAASFQQQRQAPMAPQALPPQPNAQDDWPTQRPAAPGAPGAPMSLAQPPMQPGVPQMPIGAPGMAPQEAMPPAVPSSQLQQATPLQPDMSPYAGM